MTEPAGEDVDGPFELLVRERGQAAAALAYSVVVMVAARDHGLVARPPSPTSTRCTSPSPESRSSAR